MSHVDLVVLVWMESAHVWKDLLENTAKNLVSLFDWFTCFWYAKTFPPIDIEYNKSLDRRRPCFGDELTEGSNL